ncbi:MAG TPA: AAA family ATPase [Candidatus Sulfotelmatobacter sp.]|nr:AAA family ATPase [Candidatus Sulfotelmatobacter sp.]
MNTSQAKSAIERILNDEARLEAAAELKAKWAGHLDKVVRHPASFGGIAIPPRDLIMGKWFKQGDLGFIYGARGLGKTWFGMFLARRCAEGPGSTGTLVEWTVHAARRILYVDGEMAMDEIRDRDHALTIGPAPGMFYLQHEALFHLTGEILNLTDPVTQSSILDKCKRDRIDILILDNQSCLFPGLSENAADAWDHVLPWLLQLRRNRIAVIIIAHAGRNGLMRGTSRREDAADWIINLTEAKEPVENQTGASFIARFVKNRTTTDADVPTLEWTFIRPPGNPNNKMQITWKKLTPSQLFRQCIEDGMNVGTQIAQHLGITTARVSQLATKGAKDGWLKKNGRHYAIKPPSPFSPGWASRPNNNNNNNPELTKSE